MYVQCTLLFNLNIFSLQRRGNGRYNLIEQFEVKPKFPINFLNLTQKSKCFYLQSLEKEDFDESDVNEVKVYIIYT